MKYAPLEDYLKRLPAKQTEIALRFGEIERIIGAKLPKSAFTYREWWANQQDGSRAPHWRAAGFSVEAVDLSSKIVRFARTGKAGQPPVARRAKKRMAKPRTTAKKPIKAEKLINAGFKSYGGWALTDDGINFKGKLPREPGVYAHIVDGDVYYIGRSLKGFRHRMGHYRKPGPTQSTSIRINGLIKTALKSGKTVETLAAFPEPTTWNTLPVDVVSGLETGLVAKLRPPWNKQGVSG